jgi:DNA-binding response OmpR family regulator
MNKKILLIDDDDMISKTMSERFRSDGIEIVVEMDGEKGLARTKSDNPDLVILDLTLPKLDGLEVLKRIREDEEIANIPIIIFSNRDDMDTISATLEHGQLIDFIAKHEWKLEDIVTLAKKRMGMV